MSIGIENLLAIGLNLLPKCFDCDNDPDLISISKTSCMIQQITKKERTAPAGSNLRPILLIAVIAAGIAGARWTPLGAYLGKDFLLDFISSVRGTWWTPLCLIGLYAVLSLFALPTGPLLVGGALFGTSYGTLYNLTGLLGGACLSFFLAKLLGRDWVRRFTGERMHKVESFLSRHGFWLLVQTRFLPLPFAVINFGSGLAGVNSQCFLTATIVGLTPSTLIHTYFIAELLTADEPRKAVLLTLYAAIFVAFNLFLTLLWVPKWRR